MNIKQNYDRIINLLESLRTLLLSNGVGFEVCKTIDVNESVNFMDYEDKLLIYGVNFRPSLIQSSPPHDEKMNVRGLLEHLKKDGLKYGRNPIPIYKEGTKKKKISDKYVWLIKNLEFLIDIFKIRIDNFNAKWKEVQSSLADYQKYLDEGGIKTNNGKDHSKMKNCPYCLNKIQNESGICSYCGSTIVDMKK
jgi:hypothetical protein